MNIPPVSFPLSQAGAARKNAPGIISFTVSYYMLNFEISNGVRMIISFGNHESEDVWLGNRVKTFPWKYKTGEEENLEC